MESLFLACRTRATKDITRRTQVPGQPFQGKASGISVAKITNKSQLLPAAEQTRRELPRIINPGFKTRCTTGNSPEHLRDGLRGRRGHSSHHEHPKSGRKLAGALHSAAAQPHALGPGTTWARDHHRRRRRRSLRHWNLRQSWGVARFRDALACTRHVSDDVGGRLPVLENRHGERDGHCRSHPPLLFPMAALSRDRRSSVCQYYRRRRRPWRHSSRFTASAANTRRPGHCRRDGLRSRTADLGLVRIAANDIQVAGVGFVLLLGCCGSGQAGLYRSALGYARPQTPFQCGLPLGPGGCRRNGFIALPVFLAGKPGSGRGDCYRSASRLAAAGHLRRRTAVRFSRYQDWHVLLRSDHVLYHPVHRCDPVQDRSHRNQFSLRRRSGVTAARGKRGKPVVCVWDHRRRAARGAGSDHRPGLRPGGIFRLETQPRPQTRACQGILCGNCLRHLSGHGTELHRHQSAHCLVLGGHHRGLARTSTHAFNHVDHQ